MGHHDDFVAALNQFLHNNDELKIISFENKTIHRNQSKSDGFPTKKKKKPCYSICKAEHLRYLCSHLSSLGDVQKKILFLQKGKVCTKCLYTFSKDHKCPEYNKRIICHERKTNFSVCKCRKNGTGPAGGIEDSDLVEPVTTNNLAKINGNMLGAVGFDTEVLQFIMKDGNVKNVLVTYDYCCSHTMS